MLEIPFALNIACSHLLYWGPDHHCNFKAVSAFQENGGTVLLPLGGLYFLRRVAKMGGGKNLILIGDKGIISRNNILPSGIQSYA